MRRIALAAPLALLALLVAPAPAWAAKPSKRTTPPIGVTISVPAPSTHYVDVRVKVPALTKRGAVQLQMPAWTPGSYKIRDFGRHVHDVEARAGSTELDVQRTDKQTWSVASGGAAFEFSYRVYADALSVRSSFVDDRIAFLNGASVFVYVVGHKEHPIQVNVDRTPAGWQTYTAMDRSGAGWWANGYDELADSPLLLGEAEVRSFEVAGAKLRYVLAAPGGTNANIDRLAGDAEKIVQAFADIMGGLPFPNYDFLVVADPQGGGGLEHLRSTGMMVRSHAFTQESAYERAAHLAAHEFFHLWNVKRIHDRPLGPFDYTQETYTDLLWFHEGFTETMEARAMLRAGLMDRATYLESLGQSYTRYRNRPGSDVEPIAALSRDAWIKLYQNASSDRNRTVSYYLKGDLIGVTLDLELRKRSGGAGSVEGMFAALWAGRASGSDKVLVDRDVITKAASDQAGEDMGWFFERFVWGTETLPLPDRLAEVDVHTTELAPWEAPPTPLVPETDPASPDPDPWAERNRAWIGLQGGDDTLSWVPTGSPAERAGMMVGDHILAVNGVRVGSIDEARERVADAGVGSRVRLTFFRRDRLERRVVSVGESPERTWTFSVPDPTDAAAESIKVRDAWLPPPTVPAPPAAGSTAGEASH